MKKIFAKDLSDQMNVTAAFRKVVPAFEQGLTLKIAASNVFRMMADGKLIGYGPMRSAHGYSNLSVYSLDAYRGRGFCLTVEVVSYQCGSYYIVDEKPFFACEIYRGTEKLYDSGDFTAYRLTDRLQKVQRYSFQRTFAESYALSQDRSAFYLGHGNPFPELPVCEVAGNTIIETDLPYPALNEIRIAAQIEAGDIFELQEPHDYSDRAIFGISPMFKGFEPGELESFISEEAGRIGYRKTGEQGKLEIKDGYRLFDLGQNYSSFLGARIRAVTDCEIYFIFDEIIWDEAKKDPVLEKWYGGAELPLSFHRMSCCNVVKYKLSGGEDYNLLSFEPYTMRYLKIIVRGAAVLKETYHIPYENSAAERLHFRTSDAKINQIFGAAVNTFKQNAVDVLTDCPSRERAGWLCDSYFSGKAEQLITGGNKVEHNFLKAYLLAPQLAQLPKEMLPACYPADHFNGGYIPNWAMFFVIELEDYLLRTGDRALIDRCRDKVLGLIDFFERYRNKDGLLEKLDSWVFVEWSKAAEFVQDVNFPTNMLYCKMLKSAAALYGMEELSRRADKVQDAIIALSYNGEFFEDNLVYENDKLVKKGNVSETCQYYAFYFGIADPETFPRLYDTMFTVFGSHRDDSKVFPNVYRSNAFIGNFLRLDYLKRMGRIRQVYDECFEYFGYMAERTGTLWENDQPHASCNHGFASYAAAFFMEAVAGYKGFDPVGKTVYVCKPAVPLDF
ncbi:MAG: hypothetical protein FWE62_07055, partial [Firmicutes bacterium]|nr:hypothetical protein [Bacillota bacterium]